MNAPFNPILSVTDTPVEAQEPPDSPAQTQEAPRSTQSRHWAEKRAYKRVHDILRKGPGGA